MANGSKRIERIIRKERTKKRERQVIDQVAMGYVRVSTDEQANNGHGIEVQEQALRAFAVSQGYHLLDVVEDAGVSGAMMPAKRPGFSRILEQAEVGAFSVLLVWKIDRLARSLVHAVTVTNQLNEDHGVVLRSVTEPIDTATPMGQTIFAMLAGMAQQERQVITERTLAGKKAKASKGGFAGGTAPYGYRANGKGGLVVDEKEAVVVRQIFSAREGGKTLQQIADLLNAQNAPTRRGGRWHPATVRYILDNPKYKGEIEYLFRWGAENLRVFRKGEQEPIIHS